MDETFAWECHCNDFLLRERGLTNSEVEDGTVPFAVFEMIFSILGRGELQFSLLLD